ncbi:aminoglycoside phosphotransferase family protein [Streptomyces sp. NPDC002896]|uniref:phosphotransferase family protein n=1 Tax=Streptomyces sp. NPDC002896 TaxID=3154438 RepID=UPI00331E4E63
MTSVNGSPHDNAASAVARRHQVPSREVRALPSGGANHVYRLGDSLVLRIPRSSSFVADLRKEVKVIPVARAAGVRTPAVVEFDDSGSLADVPYVVLEHVPGVDLAELRLSPSERESVYRQVGRELARLHRVALADQDQEQEPGNVGVVPVEDDGEDPRELVARLRAGGMIDAGAQEWLVGWLDRLSSHLQGTSPHVLLHGDIAPQNIMVSPDSADLGGLVDWGDAVWADPAVEFAKTPLADVVTMLKGYREENGEEPSAGSADNAGFAWEARILRHHLVWSLGRLVNPAANPGERHWTAPPASRLLGLLRFYASAPEKPWRDLT